jgi:hypothetical protein
VPAASRHQQARKRIVTHFIKTFRQLDRIAFGRAITQGYDVEVEGRQGSHITFSTKEVGSPEVTLIYLPCVTSDVNSTALGKAKVKGEDANTGLVRETITADEVTYAFPLLPLKDKT